MTDARAPLPPSLSLADLARHCEDAARAEIGAIVACEQIAAWGGSETRAAVTAIRTRAEALAAAARVMRALAADPAASLGADPTQLQELL